MNLSVALEAVLLTVGRSYVGNDVTHSTLLDGACACSYENPPKYRSYRVSNTAPWTRFCKDRANAPRVRLEIITSAVLRLECSIDCISVSVGH